MAYSGKTNWVNNEIVEAVDMNRIEQGITNLDALKADKTYVDNKVKTDVPLNAKFTDTIVDISGKQDKLTAGNNITITNNTISATDTKYTHPTHTAKANGLYKVTVDNQGHVSATSAVAKADITALGIPAQDTVVDISGKLNKSNDTLETYTEKIQATTGVINLSLANVFTDTPSASRTYSITNAKSGVAHSFTLIITMGATVRTLTFPNSVKWQGGEIPDMSTASKTYILTFVTVDGGTTWLGMSGGEF